MGNYLPTTSAQQKEMLRVVGAASFEELYGAVPQSLLNQAVPALPEGKSELEVSRFMTALSEKNTTFQTIFRGAGAYRHYIPSIVKSIPAKETFTTAYTPYQAEISQGILQSIFEYQTMICELTGMDASNASVYDGATAAAEAVAMCRDRKRNQALISATAHPDVIATIQTYCNASGTELILIPAKEGKTDLVALEQLLDDQTACVYMQQPNFYGLLEDAAALSQRVHQTKGKLIMGINPIAAALFQTPFESGADIAVGEGQPLGLPLSFGGPYLGFMATTGKLVRKLPGRMVGQTKDTDGKRAYVLTLQAREQHIRREKASSNICSNQALCAMTAAVYLAVMGEQGLKEVATQCMSKSHYLAEQLCRLPGFSMVFEGEFFHEFLTTCPVDSQMILSHLAQHGILGGLSTEQGILWCATEINTKEEMDRMVQLIGEVL